MLRLLWSWLQEHPTLHTTSPEESQDQIWCLLFPWPSYQKKRKLSIIKFFVQANAHVLGHLWGILLNWWWRRGVTAQRVEYSSCCILGLNVQLEILGLLEVCFQVHFQDINFHFRKMNLEVNLIKISENIHSKDFQVHFPKMKVDVLEMNLKAHF